LGILSSELRLRETKPPLKTLSMKPSTMNVLCCAAAIFFAASSVVLSQATTATTDPVGFITLNVAGTGGTSAEALSFKGLGLTRPVEYQGSAETVGASTLVDNEATWTDNQFNGAGGAFYVEIISGTNAGTTYDVSATTAANKTITLAQPLAAGTTAPVSFKVRKHWTFASVFGANNESGLQAGNASTADQILLYNGSTYDTYYFSNAGGLVGNGWRKVGGGSADQANTTIYPDEGVIVKRLQSAAVNVVLMGAVKTGQTAAAVVGGLNFIGNVYAAGMTLNSSGIYTGNPATGLAPGNASTADTIDIYNGSTYDSYYFSNAGGLVGNGWRKIGGGSADQQNVAIPVGSSIIVNRKTAGSFNWVAPQHPTTL
jgi:uncharacterized protein (TIGR02597 family)